MEDHHLYLNLGGWGSGLRFTRVTDVDVVDNDGFVSAAIFADIDDTCAAPTPELSTATTTPLHALFPRPRAQGDLDLFIAVGSAEVGAAFAIIGPPPPAAPPAAPGNTPPPAAPMVTEPNQLWM